MSTESLNADLDGLFESLNLTSELIGSVDASNNDATSNNATNSNGNGNSLTTTVDGGKTSENGKRVRKRDRSKMKDNGSGNNGISTTGNANTSTATSVVNSAITTTTSISSNVVTNDPVINQQPTKQQQQGQSKVNTLKDQLLDMDENGFLNEDILEQQQKQFAQYEQKVNQMQEDDEEPLTPLPAGEQHHQQHPQNKYEYKESILLVNEFEQMQVSSPEEFCDKLGFDLKDSGKNRYVQHSIFHVHFILFRWN